MATVALLLTSASATPNVRRVLVRDIATIEGVRDNPLIGYGIVVGLHNTGDTRMAFFTSQALTAAMQKMGAQVPSQAPVVRNVAAVFITATLPAFARPGLALDVTVSSIGDATSLEGGVLLLTALKGADGQVYAEAQGPLSIGGYSAGNNGNTKTVNHSTVGRVPQGAVVERDTSVNLNSQSVLSLMLREPDSKAAVDIAAGINQDLNKQVATPVDSRRIDVDVKAAALPTVTALIARIQGVSIEIHPAAKVIINERTGTIVMGGDVTLSPVAVLQGNLSIEVSTTFNVSQPAPFSKTGETVVTPETNVTAQEAPAKTIRLMQGASVEELIQGLHTIGATPRDIVAILQAIKAAGGLQAELEIL